MSTSGRVTLLAHAATAAQRRNRFADDEGIEPLATARARAVRSAVGRYVDCWRGPELRTAATADALGLAATTDTALRAWDMGDWAGRTVASVAELDPAGVHAWRTDPNAAPHGGEALESLLARVDQWLLKQGSIDERTLVVADASVVRAIVVCALGLPAAAFWRFDIRPLSLTTLQRHDDTWRARVIGAVVDA